MGGELGHNEADGGVFLPRDADWLEATEALRTGFVDHPDQDLAITGPPCGATLHF